MQYPYKKNKYSLKTDFHQTAKPRIYWAVEPRCSGDRAFKPLLARVKNTSETQHWRGLLCSPAQNAASRGTQLRCSNLYSPVDSRLRVLNCAGDQTFSRGCDALYTMIRPAVSLMIQSSLSYLSFTINNCIRNTNTTSEAAGLLKVRRANVWPLA